MCGPGMGLVMTATEKNKQLGSSRLEFLPKICTTMKERELRVDGPVVCKVVMTYSYKILVLKHDGKKRIGKTRLSSGCLTTRI
jgi:hypothetical protein